jgi:hypothetical protein
MPINVPADEDEFWMGASQPTLEAVWGNEEDDVNAQFLTH